MTRPLQKVPFTNWLVAVTLPFLVMAVYLWLSRWPTQWCTGASDYIAFALSLIAFVVAVAILPMSGLKRILIAIIFTPAFALALFYFSFLFVGVFFGDWL